MKNKEKEKKDFLEKLKRMSFEEVIANSGTKNAEIGESVLGEFGTTVNNNLIDTYYLIDGVKNERYKETLELDIKKKSQEKEMPYTEEQLKEMAYKDDGIRHAKIGDSILGEGPGFTKSYSFSVKESIRSGTKV